MLIRMIKKPLVIWAVAFLAIAFAWNEISLAQEAEVDADANAATTQAAPTDEQWQTFMENNTQELGPIARWLDKNTPDTGVPVLDSMLNTLFQSIAKLTDSSIEALPNLIIALVLLLLTALIAKLVSAIVKRISRQSKLRESLVDLLGILAKVIVWLAGLASAAGILFPEFGLGQIMATAGLASIAVGFAFKDIFENFFAGVLILWRFPFENGDFIEVNGTLGKVEEVELRMTRIRRTDGELLLIPNGKIFTENVRVVTERPQHRNEVAVGVAYGEDVGKARGVILDAVKQCKSIGDQAEPEVLLSGFGASSVDYDVMWWCDSKPLPSRRSRDEVVQAIKEALDSAGIEIPYPYRTLTFSQNEPDIIKAIQGRAGSASQDDASAE